MILWTVKPLPHFLTGLTGETFSMFFLGSDWKTMINIGRCNVLWCVCVCVGEGVKIKLRKQIDDNLYSFKPSPHFAIG